MLDTMDACEDCGGAMPRGLLRAMMLCEGCEVARDAAEYEGDPFDDEEEEELTGCCGQPYNPDWGYYCPSCS